MTMLFLTSPNRLHAKNGNIEKIRKPSVIKYRRFSFPLNKTQCTPLTVKAYSCKLFWADDSFKSEFFQLTPSYRITKLHIIFFKTSFVNQINFFIIYANAVYIIRTVFTDNITMLCERQNRLFLFENVYDFRHCLDKSTIVSLSAKELYT